MLDSLANSYAIACKSPALSVLLVAASVAFFAFFIGPSLRLRAKLSGLIRQVRALKQSKQVDPRQIAIRDRRLGHLWQQFLETLHLPTSEIDPRTGIALNAQYRATMPAEVTFNAQSVYEGRIHTEFFKHLPGLLTGLGIIGTFTGLIQGLGSATAGGTALDTALLISSVRDAFYVSATAITLAMIITFIEKFLVASLHRAVEQLCQQIDVLYSSGVGEEYLSRLVQASEESASQARILKDALVGELSAILERLTNRQIEAAAVQQNNLQREFVSAIDQGVTQPLGKLAEFRDQRGNELAESLKDSMLVFAKKLEEVLGGQVGHAKDLQQQTLLALEKAVGSFQAMASQISQAGETATSTMSSHLGKAITDMAVQQEQMNTSVRTLVDDLKEAVVRTQTTTGAGVEQLLADLGSQVQRTLGSIQEQMAQTTSAQRGHLESLSNSMEATLKNLAKNVEVQSSAIEQATSAMRGAVIELGNSVKQHISMMNQGADRMRQAAELFTTSGSAISNVFDRSQDVAAELAQTAATLSQSSNEVRTVIGDYKAARETFAGIVDGLKTTVDIAKREASMTKDLVSSLEAASHKLIAAQGQADTYLAKLNQVLAEAHSSFSTSMLETVRNSNGKFHDSLQKATGLLATTIAELENALGDNLLKSRVKN